MNKLLGLHHITAIAGDAQRNYDFYTKDLGFRLVKKTVNFDDPQTYHFYFGNEVGTPGTILTFFPWTNVRQGKNGAGMATEIGYSVPKGSLFFTAPDIDVNERMREVSERLSSEEDIDFGITKVLDNAYLLRVLGNEGEQLFKLFTKIRQTEDSRINQGGSIECNQN